MTVTDLQAYAASLTDVEHQALSAEGLIVHQILAEGGYDASPSGAVAFASTGGDGVHFSVPSERLAGPVIMTVPMAFENPNFVLGENVWEFLSLGCAFGYFSLEQLAYQYSKTVAAIQSAKLQSAALVSLSARFELRPWHDVAGRLAELANA